MAQSLEQRSLTREQSIIDVNRSSCSIEKGSHFQDRPPAKHKFSRPFLDPQSEYSQTKITEHVIKFQYLENHKKTMLGSKVYNDDELVKHMSNVPCFLQQVGKEESIQERALNLGVLDGKRLEKLKYNERMPVRIHKKTSSSSTVSICMGSGPPKMSRSSSFKESSAVPQLRSMYNAVRSGPVMKVTTGADSIDKEKASSSSKGRSSPLRRLLDPLLKKNESLSTNIIQPPNGTMATRGLCPDRNSEGLSSRGLLQLSLKNGLPFFKLVLENSSNNMLAAFVKKLPAFGKSDHGMVYTFYSIHEARKKNMTWIQGSKSKRCNLGCDILGQMKISSIRIPNSRAKSLDICVVRDCVLYGVDKEQVNEEEPEFSPRNEMAAVVLQSSCQKLNDNKKLYQDKSTDGAVVILPGGVHGMPNKGAPSSLMSRWRSGGSCDCGGWDVGCKLRVLTNHNKRDRKILETSMSCSTKDRVDLFVQGREQNNKPAFNLEAISNGFYSLELDSTIPLLEAFATCVALLTSQNFSEILDANIPRDILETIIGTCKPKTTATTATTTTFSRKVPAKYATCRPLSPVGRI